MVEALWIEPCTCDLQVRHTDASNKFVPPSLRLSSPFSKCLQPFCSTLHCQLLLQGVVTAALVSFRKAYDKTPTFLYAMPTDETHIFVEDTSLVGMLEPRCWNGPVRVVTVAVFSVVRYVSASMFIC